MMLSEHLAPHSPRRLIEREAEALGSAPEHQQVESVVGVRLPSHENHCQAAGAKRLDVVVGRVVRNVAVD